MGRRIGISSIAELLSSGKAVGCRDTSAISRRTPSRKEKDRAGTRLAMDTEPFAARIADYPDYLSVRAITAIARDWSPRLPAIMSVRAITAITGLDIARLIALHFGHASAVVYRFQRTGTHAA